MIRLFSTLLSAGYSFCSLGSQDPIFTLVGHRPALIQHLTLGATQDGTLQAVKHDVQSTVSFSKFFVEAAAHRTSRLLYKSPNIQVSHTLVPWDVGGPTSMRAPGYAPGMFALECAMDELAVKSGVDPVELRVKNDSDLYPGKNVPRGIGEIGITGMPASIANAVFNATGKRIRQVPIRPENLLPSESGQPTIS